MRYFLYARKSTDTEDKQVLSIEAQLSELRTLARRDELEVIEEFVEKRSAKTPGRPVFEEMMRRIERGEAQGIVCWKIDRLSRNPVDSGRVSWLLQQSVIAKIITHDRVYLPHDNVLLMSVEFGMANQYVRDLSVNVARGMSGSILIDDSYNASPAAVEQALATLKEFPGARRRIAILGDMLELGRYSVVEHQRIAAIAHRSADLVIAVGIRARAFIVADNPVETLHFDNAHSACEALPGIVKTGDVILVKGSQSIRTERIVEALLADPADLALLVRQEKAWKKR